MRLLKLEARLGRRHRADVMLEHNLLGYLAAREWATSYSTPNTNVRLAFMAAMTAAFLASRLPPYTELTATGMHYFPDFAQIYIAGRHILHGQGRSLYDQFFYREVNGVLQETDGGLLFGLSAHRRHLHTVALLSYPVAAWTHAILAALVACWLARDMARYFSAHRMRRPRPSCCFCLFFRCGELGCSAKTAYGASPSCGGRGVFGVPTPGFLPAASSHSDFSSPNCSSAPWIWACSGETAV